MHSFVKVMLDVPDEVQSLLSGKLALTYSGSADLEAMKAVAVAAKRRCDLLEKKTSFRSLADFNTAFGSYREELQCDPVVKKHFAALSERMLEKDLCRIIEPYSTVEIDHIAGKIGLDRIKVWSELTVTVVHRWRRSFHK